MDTTTDEPAMATVRTGLPTRHRLVFVPLQDAIAGPGYLKVSYVRTLVKQAPSIGTDGVLPAEQEEAIFKHYGLPYQAPVRPANGNWRAADHLRTRRLPCSPRQTVVSRGSLVRCPRGR